MNERFLNLAATELSEISEEFADEIERRPTSVELFEVLTWAVKSCRDDQILDINPSNIISLEPKFKQGNNCIGSLSNGEQIESAVADLNDNIFVIATEFISNLTSIIQSDTGQAPTLNQLCDILAAGLHQCHEDLFSDISPSQIIGIKSNSRKQGKIVSKVGDIIAIPAKNGEFFIACVLTKNCFGTAYGLFEGTSSPRPISLASHPPVKQHPIYSGDGCVANNRWKIIAHDEDILSLFPAEPEIYHYDPVILEDFNLGPYGSGETASGELRQLTKEEAEELGLLSGKYRQTYLPEYLEEYLNETLI